MRIDYLKKFWAPLLGVGIVLVAFGADLLGIGGDFRIGLKQILLGLFGLALTSVGLDDYFWNRRLPRTGADQRSVRAGLAVSLLGFSLLLVDALLYTATYIDPFLERPILAAGAGLFLIGLLLRLARPAWYAAAIRLIARKIWQFLVYLLVSLWRFVVRAPQFVVDVLAGQALLDRIHALPFPAAGFLRSVIVIELILIGVMIAASDLFRGSFFVFLISFLLGLGPALFLFSFKRQAEIVVAFAPTIGFSLIHLIGVGLVRLDLTVLTWTWPFTWTGLALSLAICRYYYAKNKASLKTLAWGRIGTVMAGFGLVLLLSIVPVAVGGLRFSVFRGNPDDANNYMAMAQLLNQVPYSLIRAENVQWLYDMNPVYPWAAGIVEKTRWATSMVMAYTANLSGVPIYRFDFAFTTLCFGYMFGPSLALTRRIAIKPAVGFLLALGVSLGFYAQIVADLRAVSEATSFAIQIALIFVIAAIWEETAPISWRQPGSLRPYLLAGILVAVLTLAYIEVLFTFGFGIFLFAVVVFIKREIDSVKSAWLIGSALAGFAAAILLTPALYHFIIAQFGMATNSRVQWALVYFKWLYEAYLAGPFGLTPFSLNTFLLILMSLWGGALIGSLLLSGIQHLALKRKTNAAVQLCLCLAFSALLFFGLLSLQGKTWQAGKAFTFGYPFLMFSIGVVKPRSWFGSSSIQRKKFNTILNRMLRGGVVVWLLSQALLGVYRFAPTGWGFEYPYSMVDSTVGDYQNKYDWNLQPYLEIIKKSDQPTVWISGNIHLNEFLSLPFDSDVQLISTSMMSGWTLLHDKVRPVQDWPDYLLMDRAYLILGREGVFQPHIVYSDARLALIRVPPELSDDVWLLGMHGINYSDSFMLGSNDRPGVYIVDRKRPVALQFLAGQEGKVKLSASLTPRKENQKLPGGIQCKLLSHNNCGGITGAEQVEFSFDVQRGYNFLMIAPTIETDFWINSYAIEPAVEQ